MSELPDFTNDKARQGFVPRAGILWSHGLGTLEIAKRLGVQEPDVYNRIALIKQWAKDHRAS